VVKFNDGPGNLQLREYLFCTPEDEAAILERLMAETAAPLVKRVVRRRFFNARDTGAEDQEDVCADATTAIVARVQAMRRSGEPNTVQDFEAYVAGVAGHASTRFFLARSPQRVLLRNRLRYVLTTDRRFRIWLSDHGLWFCCLPGENPATAVLSDADVEKCRATLSATALPEGRLQELVKQIFDVARGAMELTALTSLAADSLGMTDRRSEMEDISDTMAAKETSIADHAEMKQSVRFVWSEVCELPVEQRRALLLNPGPGGGAGQSAGAWLVADLGIATLRGVAEALEMPAEELADMWNRLPLSDNEIAERFGLDRQQVIHLRSAARQRLNRKMAI
jgi:hypothetical protein